MKQCGSCEQEFEKETSNHECPNCGSGNWVEGNIDIPPTIGVISIHNVDDSIWDCEEICLICDPFYYYFDKDICPDCMMETLETPDDDYPEVKRCNECEQEFDIENVFCEDHEKLIGDWKIITNKDGSIQYEPDENGEFSAIVNSSSFSTIQVVYSKFTTKVRAFCSPCFPNQADLDSGEGDILCYTLPDYLLPEENFIDVEKE